jgi:two-component system alkaline phosphatase synthesis response regulator PhoP
LRTAQLCRQAQSKTNRAPFKAINVTQQTILVVDDEPDVLLLCRVNLEFEGYLVVEASDGNEALEQMRRLQPDLVLLDVMMPRKDGWSALKEAKADSEIAHIPIVLLTAKVQEVDQIRGFELGASEYVTKPFSPLALAKTIGDVLCGDPAVIEQRRAGLLSRLLMLQRT